MQNLKFRKLTYKDYMNNRREIEFRAWDDRKKEMCEPFIWFSESQLEDYIVMQYTGVKDINGKKIFDGDILRTENKLGIVRWDELEARFRVYFEATRHLVAYNYPVSSSHKYEVIGNIYERPELLKNAY